MNKWLTPIVTVVGIWSVVAAGAIAQTPSYEEIDAMSCQEYQQLGDREGRDFFGQIYNEQGEDAAMLWLSKGGNCVLSTIETAVPAAPAVPTLVDLEQMPCDDIKAILTDGSTVARWDFGAEWNLWLERYEACEPGSVIRLGS
ncbi:MAG: hypothetical protein WBB29_02940 [Geitlerinemataceae cyanobacterium]